MKKKYITVITVAVLACMLFSGCKLSDTFEKLIGVDTLFIKGENKKSATPTPKNEKANATPQTSDSVENGDEVPVQETPNATVPQKEYSGYMIDVSAYGDTYQKRFSYLVSNINGGIFSTLENGKHTFYHAFHNPNSFSLKVAFAYQAKLSDDSGNEFWGDCGSYGEPCVLLAPGETKVLTTAFDVENNQTYIQGNIVPVSKLFTRISVSTANDTVPESGTYIFVTDTKWMDIQALGAGDFSNMGINASIHENGYEMTGYNSACELPEISESDKKTYNGAAFVLDGGTKNDYNSDPMHIAKYFISEKGALHELDYKLGTVNTYTFVFKNTSDRELEMFADFQGTVKSDGKEIWAGPSSGQNDQYKFYSVPAGKTAVIKIPVYISNSDCVIIFGQNVSVSQMFFRFDVRMPNGTMLPAGTKFEASIANEKNGSNLKYNSVPYSDTAITVK